MRKVFVIVAAVAARVRDCGGSLPGQRHGHGRIAHVDGKMCEEDHNGSKPSICTGWQAVDNP